ncbi:hypothetical protein HDV03_003182 [Kappamyces sp. JEL0829]|nr:hypothetical protein HDV03_003182 [Kappamyces sp. JEL0829]
MVGEKEDAEAPFWPRLNKSGKLAWIKTDFAKWKEEDEDDEEEAPGGDTMMNDQMMQMMGGMGQGMNGFNPDMLKGMMGAGAADEEADSDDEEMPSLESA